jgi:Carbohydrate family 9 binding domain-like
MRVSHAVWALIMGACLLFGAACVGGSKGITAEDREKLKGYVLDALPADVPHKVDINFENKVHIVGYKVDPEPARPGTEVKLTYYWRCDDTPEDGWGLFTHVEDDGANNAAIGNLDTNGPIREVKNGHQILGPDRWEKGKFYVDEQTYKVPDNVKGATFTVYVGVWKGDARLRIIAGPNDGDNRAIVAKVRTGLAPPPSAQPAPPQHTEVPTMSVKKLAAGQKIIIDGKADEAAWGGAPSTGPFVDVATGEPAPQSPVGGSAKVLWDDQNLYVFFDVQEADFYTGFTDAKSQPKDFTTTGQPKLWTKDTVEMMVDPDGDGDNKDYYELQINPQNKVFHSQFDTLQQPNGGPDGPFGHEDWDPKLKSAVVVTKGKGYTVEAAIPWAAYSKAQRHPPAEGDTWRVNFYAMKNNGGVSWSPILRQGTFHKASRFGRITWGTAPLPEAGAAAMAAGEGGPPSPVASGGFSPPPGIMRFPRLPLGLRPGMAPPQQPQQAPPP